jgi:hypothetical protein
MGQLGMAHVMLFFIFSFFSPFLALNYYVIFLYLYITKMSSRLTFYHLKDKRGHRLESPYRLTNYGSSFEWILDFALVYGMAWSFFSHPSYSLEITEAIIPC